MQERQTLFPFRGVQEQRRSIPRVPRFGTATYLPSIAFHNPLPQETQRLHWLKMVIYSLEI